MSDIVTGSTQAGPIYKTFCNNYAKIYIVCSAASEDVLNGTRQIKVQVYLDTKFNTTAVRDGWTADALPAYSNKSYVTFNGNDYYFSTPAVSKGNAVTLLGTITTDPVSLTAVEEQFQVSANVYLNGLKMRKNLVSTWTSAEFVTASGIITVKGIDSRATLTISDGTLDTAQNITIGTQYSGFTYKVAYVCGTASGTIYNGGTTGVISWTPPLSLASQNTTSAITTATVTLTTTNAAGVVVGSHSDTITLTFPASVKPSIALTITDGEGHLQKYGKYIQNISTFDVVATCTKAYGADITSTKITANGDSYTDTSFTTGVIKIPGTQQITASVTDTRMRTGTKEVTVDVYAYTSPIISTLKVKRCNVDNTENPQGEYLQVTFSANVTSLDGKNSAKYALQYKKSKEGTFSTPVEFSSLSGNYSVSNFYYTFPADTGSAYDIIVTATDDFSTTSRNTNGSTALVIMHFKASGRGMGIGKISERDDVVDMGFMVRFFNGLLLKEPGEGANYNNLLTPNIYFSSSEDVDSYENCPVNCDHALTVYANSAGTKALQRIDTFESTPRTLTRNYKFGVWYSWV